MPLNFDVLRLWPHGFEVEKRVLTWEVGLSIKSGLLLLKSYV